MVLYDLAGGWSSVAAKTEGRSFLDKLAAPAVLLALVGLIWYQNESLRGEIRDLRTELRTEIGDLRTEIGDLRETVGELEVAVARIEARDSLRLRLAERFAAAGEGASYGGPVIAADLLLARALPEIDAVLATIDKDAQTELEEELWEDRANILARAAPGP